MTSRAKYLPALNSCFMNGIRDEYIQKRDRWQPHFKQNQFNVFSRDCDVYCGESLLSAGHEPYKRVEVQYEQLKTRGSDTMLMGDSGGFQIATDKLKINWQDPQNVDDVRLGILKFLEANCDIAATLDVPTFTIGQEGFKFNTFQQCLDQTINNLDFWMKHRTPGELKLLNVVQGRNEPEVDEWFEAVKDYPTEGWCFSSANSDSVYHMIRSMLLLIKHDKLNDNQKWVHVLGRTMPAVSVILSDLQNRVRERTNVELQISYDSSSFVQAAITGNALDHTLTNKLSISINKKDISYEACKNNPMSLTEYLGSDSKLGEAIKLEHMYIWHEKEEKWYWDVPTYAQIMAYNYEMTHHLMDKAHEKYANDDVSSTLLAIKHDVMPAIFAHDDIDECLAELKRHKQILLTGVLKYTEPAVFADTGLFDW